jgi:hypothetical protein
MKVQTGAAAAVAGKTAVCSFGSGSVKCLTWGLNDKPISNGEIATLSFPPLFARPHLRPLNLLARSRQHHRQAPQSKPNPDKPGDCFAQPHPG